MNVIDFISQSAAYIAKERPDIYDSAAEAAGDLTTALDILRESGDPQGMCMFSGYALLRFLEDGVEEIFLSRKLASLALFEEEEICRAYGWVEGIELDDPFDEALDEPDED
jgi:hypothetical protein